MLTIGQEIYAFVECRGVFTYVVKEVRTSETLITYVVECQNCNHEKCLVLVVKSQNGETYKYIQMENNQDEYYWHSTNVFHVDKLECRKSAYKHAISKQKDRVSDATYTLEKEKKRLEEITALLEGLVE